MGKPAVYREGNDLILQIRVQPRASKDEIVGLHGTLLKIRITAPPVDGKANSHLLKYLAKCFGVPGSRVHLLSGETGREKRVRIDRPEKIPPILKSLEM